MHATLRLGPNVKGLVIYDAPWVHDVVEREEYATLRAQVEQLLDRGRNAAALRRFLTGIGMPRGFIAVLPLLPGWRTMVRLAPTLRYDLELTANLPPLDLAAQVEVPTHVLVGERSPAELHDVARALAETVPGATYATLAGQDHMVAAKTLPPVLVDRLRNDPLSPEPQSPRHDSTTPVPVRMGPRSTPRFCRRIGRAVCTQDSSRTLPHRQAVTA